MEVARTALTRAGAEATPEEVQHALRKAAAHVERGGVDRGAYQALVRVLIDRVAPVLSGVSGDAERDFDAIFLHGPPSLAFAELIDALRAGGVFVDVLARTLAVFVAEGAGGGARLRAIVSEASIPGVGAPLVHLPTRVANAVLGSGMGAGDCDGIVDEREYFGLLADAIFCQPLVADPVRDDLVADILGRLCVTGGAAVIVARWAAHGDGDRLASILLKAPESAIEALVRAVVELITKTRAARRVVATALQHVLRDSRTARDACLYSIPLHRPLLKRPRTGLARLTRAVCDGCGSSVAEIGLQAVVEVWSDEQFAMHGDFRLQRQVTRLLLLYIRATTAHGVAGQHLAADAVTLSVARGVHTRLTHGEARIRRHAMVVGEAASQRCGDENVLSFPREKNGSMGSSKAGRPENEEDGGDSDFSELAHNVGEEHHDSGSDGEYDDASSSLSQVAKDGNDQGEVPALESNGNGFHRKSDGAGRSVTRVLDSTDDDALRDWQLEDDWESLESYAMTSDSDSESAAQGPAGVRSSDYDAIRKRVSAPMSVSRMLGLLEKLNSGGDTDVAFEPALIAASLRTIAARASASGYQGTLFEAAADLASAVLFVDPNRFPDQASVEVSAARSEALQALVALSIESVGAMLIEKVICGNTSDLSRRSEGLTLLANAARAVSAQTESRTEASDNRQGSSGRDVDASVSHKLGTVTRRLSRSLRVSAVTQRRAQAHTAVVVNPFSAAAAGLFFALANGALDNPDQKQDAALTAQVLATLAVFLSRAGAQCARRASMRIALMELCSSRAHDNEVAVRRAVALALGAVADTTAAHEFGEVEANEAVQWLTEAASGGDADVYVRRFAASAAGIWAKKAEEASAMNM